MAGVTDVRETYKTLDLALRIGEILLSSGAGAADVTATMVAVSQHLGFRNPDVDVTFTGLRMGYQAEPEDVPVVLNRVITQRVIDYDDLTRTHHIVLDLLGDRIGLDEARALVARTLSTGHWVPRWAVVLGNGVVGGAVGLLFGGGLLVVTVAFLAAVGIDLLNRALSRRRIPMFYQQTAGGLLGTLLAVGTAALGFHADLSLVITASIVLGLSGIGFMGAVQDALSGFYVTAGARILEAMLATAGLIAGVSAGLGLAPKLGVTLGQIHPGAIGLADAPLVLTGACIAATAFAFTTYAPLRALPAVAMTTFLGTAAYVALSGPGGGRAWSSAVAAVVIGAASYSIAGRVGVPPLVVVVPALVPLLPGLEIFRGLNAMSLGQTQGVLFLVTAAATTIALAAGVILGEYLAQPVKRNARRLEHRLAGPRMVGALHGVARRRKTTMA